MTSTWEAEGIQLYLGDCLKILPTLADGSVDAVIADIPYGATACKWDTVIPFGPMWEQIGRITKKRAAIVLFGSQPFTSALIMSNPEQFRYEWIWDKRRLTGFLDSKRRPLKKHENIVVFANGQTVYNPVMGTGIPYRHVGKRGPGGQSITADKSALEKLCPIKNNGTRYPVSIIETKSERGLHPTQKPVALLEYLVETYTNEGEIVLDFTMGSGTTGVACVKTGRSFIGIEINHNYFEIAKNRIQEAMMQPCLEGLA